MASLKVVKTKVLTDPPIMVHVVEVRTAGGMWRETFGTAGELSAFQQGLRAAVALRMDNVPEPHYEEVRVFYQPANHAYRVEVGGEVCAACGEAPSHPCHKI